ncbi:MAG TPA: hypothetical protein VKZ65_07850 [Glycomyces sp.]|nr:hypothetical protein [Glycomyces sp.]
MVGEGGEFAGVVVVDLDRFLRAGREVLAGIADQSGETAGAEDLPPFSSLVERRAEGGVGVLEVSGDLGGRVGDRDGLPLDFGLDFEEHRHGVVDLFRVHGEHVGARHQHRPRESKSTAVSLVEQHERGIRPSLQYKGHQGSPQYNGPC